MPELTIAIIGTAGRKDDGPRLSAELFQKMTADAAARIATMRQSNPGSDTALISGGAAWADHVAVRLYLDGNAKRLTLFLPAELQHGRFVERPTFDRFDTGRTANYYHRLFKEKTGIDGLKEIEAAIAKGAVADTSQPGFKERNTLVARKANHLLAYTFGPGREITHPGHVYAETAGLRNGGTADTWNKAIQAISKTHIPLDALARRSMPRTPIEDPVPELTQRPMPAKPAPQTDISQFDGPNRFLSNFWPAHVVLDNVAYPTVEHAYQAAKTTPDKRAPFLAASSPEQAKRLGRTITPRPDWDNVKITVMKELLQQKFADPALAKMLLATENAQLIEGNHWGDRFWGQSPAGSGNGSNHLGHLLMEIRQTLRDHMIDRNHSDLAHETSNPNTTATPQRDPDMEATMYFHYGKDKRPDFRSTTTFDAIVAGERTSTTRFMTWQGYNRWASIKPGSIVRFWSEQNVGQGKSVDVVVKAAIPVNLATMTNHELEAWSKREGWTPLAGRQYGQKYGPGIQIIFENPTTTKNRDVHSHTAGQSLQSPANIPIDKTPEKPTEAPTRRIGSARNTIASALVSRLLAAKAPTRER